MTGWRIGYAAASLEFVNAMNKLQGHVTSNASSISQAAALEALYGPQDSVAAMKKEFESRRNLIFDLVTSIDGIKCFKPKGAFYLFPNISCYFGKIFDNCKIKNSYDLAMYLLKEAKVATVPGTGFGKEGHIRISFSTSQEKIKEGIDRIKLALQKLF
jgi:aspartate aminotransferase